MDPDPSQPSGNLVHRGCPTGALAGAGTVSPVQAPSAGEPVGSLESDPSRTADPLEILLAHDAWATRQLLRACRSLPEAGWHRRFDIGPGSLHDTLTHVVGAMRRWADRIHDPPRPVRPTIEGDTRRSVAELTAVFEEAATDLVVAAASARHRGLATVRDVTLGDESHRFSLAAMLVHVVTHGTHHRGQCLNMLHRLAIPGVSDRLPDIDVLDRELEIGGVDVTPSR